MNHTMISQRRLEKTEGCEGPKHDPYGYEERTVYVNDVTVTLHSGLGVWCKASAESGGAVETHDEEKAVALFSIITRMTPDQFDRAYLRLTEPPRRCPSCRSKVEYHSGYVGESIACCSNPSCKVGIVWSQDVTESMIQ